MKKLLIYGNGRIAKIVYQYLKHDYDVAAFTVSAEHIDATKIEDIDVIPFEGIEQHYSPDECSMIIAVGYANMNKVRETVIQEALQKTYNLINYIHPSASITACEIAGTNNVILDNVSIQPYCKLGSGNFIWSNAVIAHGTALGDNNWITSGAVVAGDAVIGNNTFIGINSTVSHNVQLGDHAFLGANTLANKNLEAGAVVISPAGEKMRLDSTRFLQFSGV